LLFAGCAPKNYDHSYTNNDELTLEAIDNTYKAGNKDEAKKAAVRFLSAHPSSLRAMTTLGNIYFAELDYRNAASVYQEALLINDKNPLILSNMSICLLHQNRVKEAQKYAQKAAIIDDKYQNTLLEIEQALKEKQ
jgi:tetratricopeptide (TPR) repeat protein